MGRKRTPGLRKRGQYWHIEKQIYGRRLNESTRTGSLEEAEQILAKRIEDIRHAVIFGTRPKYSFTDGATRYLLQFEESLSYVDKALQIKILRPFLQSLTLDRIHMGVLQPFISERRKEGRKARTINYALQTVRHMLNLAASEWVDDHGLTWLAHAPKIKLLPQHDARKPQPLTWEEQERLFGHLPDYLRYMALFAVNSGCRATEICELRWAWEIETPGLRFQSVFLIPSNIICKGKKQSIVKNGEDRVVVLNSVTKDIIEKMRGIHPEYVFSCRGKPITGGLTNTSWYQARQNAELPDARFHDLKHTFGRRLRSAGVDHEVIRDLLGHKSNNITSHYSKAELSHLEEMAERIVKRDSASSDLLILKHMTRTKSGKNSSGTNFVARSSTRKDEHKNVTGKNSSGTNFVAQSATRRDGHKEVPGNTPAVSNVIPFKTRLSG